MGTTAGDLIKDVSILYMYGHDPRFADKMCFLLEWSPPVILSETYIISRGLDGIGCTAKKI
jgi:hypothetical protein